MWSRHPTVSSSQHSTCSAARSATALHAFYCHLVCAIAVLTALHAAVLSSMLTSICCSANSYHATSFGRNPILDGPMLRLTLLFCRACMPANMASALHVAPPRFLLLCCTAVCCAQVTCFSISKSAHLPSGCCRKSQTELWTTHQSTTTHTTLRRGRTCTTSHCHRGKAAQLTAVGDSAAMAAAETLKSGCQRHRGA
jgi:hypothetical protein